MYLLGVDVGTSGCKVALFNSAGNLIKTESEEYSVVAPHPGWVELDPETVWRAFVKSLRSVINHFGNSEISYAMSFSFLGEPLILARSDGSPLYRAILSSDTRSEAYASIIKKEFSEKQFFSVTGRYAHPMGVLPKILWLQKKMPEVYKGADLLLDFQSWFMIKLGLPAVTDYSSTSGTMLFDIWKEKWADDIISWANIPQVKLPSLVSSGTKLGELKSVVKAKLGFKPNTKVTVIIGAMDQMCNALGTGTVEDGDMVCSTGTVECTTTILPKSVSDDDLLRMRLLRAVGAIPDQFQTHTVSWTAGGSLRWFRDNFCLQEIQKAKKTNTNSYDAIVGEKTSSSSVFFLPHLAGSGTPWWDSSSRGAFLGLNLATTRQMIIDGLLEGVTFELRQNLENLEKIGFKIDSVCVVSGGSKSVKWLQLKADILNKKIICLKCKENGCLGAAILAGFGIGLFSSLGETAKEKVEIETVYQPDTTRFKLYSRKYAIYKKIYPVLKKINQDITRLQLT